MTWTDTFAGWIWLVPFWTIASTCHEDVPWLLHLSQHVQGSPPVTVSRCWTHAPRSPQRVTAWVTIIGNKHECATNHEAEAGCRCLLLAHPMEDRTSSGGLAHSRFDSFDHGMAEPARSDLEMPKPRWLVQRLGELRRVQNLRNSHMTNTTGSPGSVAH